MWSQLTVLDLIKARPQPSPADSSLLIAPKIKPQIVGQPSHLARLLFLRQRQTLLTEGVTNMTVERLVKSPSVYLVIPSCWPRTQVLCVAGHLRRR